MIISLYIHADLFYWLNDYLQLPCKKDQHCWKQTIVLNGLQALNLCLSFYEVEKPSSQECSLPWIACEV
ncbi:hypothetical protein Leryth_002757 [Lithospermum erythrorhizon]|nr:hypothetical protein Leryth_002757 [Lithospermum erythrorhizon]